MKDFSQYYDQCAIAAMQSLIVASHTDLDRFHAYHPNGSEDEFYTIPRLAEDAHRIAKAMTEYAQAHSFQTLPGQVSYVDSEGMPYGTSTNQEGKR